MKGMHGIIFSYEKRNDLRELGEIRSASSIPFGGRYRAVDFSLSNLVNAGVTDVGVVLHGHYQRPAKASALWLNPGWTTRTT